LPVRVVAGSAGGLRLTAPPGRSVRPTTDKVRAAIFSSLESLGAVAGAEVYDLFAGTGALGIEALSRGARRVTFVDDDGGAVRAIEANLRRTGLAGGEVVRRDALAFAARAPRVELAFADPPYAFDRWQEVLARPIADLVVVESGRPQGLGDAWEVIRSRRYGDTVVTMARPAG
jgi:16S rRNA (guanine966-N2)-methyltransferase